MEKIAKGLVIILVAAVLSIPFVGNNLTADPGIVELRARMPEYGGWSQDFIRGSVNSPLRLRLTSDDVIHSFTVAKTDFPSIEVYPGKIKELELIFNEPGEYTFYCSRWCGVNHWRMRGTIKIDGERPIRINAEDPPGFLVLGIDIDAPHLAIKIPTNRPSAVLGQQVALQNPQYLGETIQVWANSPENIFITTRSLVSPDILDDGQVWDMVAWAINRVGSSRWLERGKALYRDNCLACHGEDGRGAGVMVRDLPPMDHAKMGTEAVRPPDFSDSRVLIGASPALLEGKIIRGGMGTGMPNWGSILSNDEIKSLVLYLYTFQFDLKELP